MNAPHTRNEPQARFVLRMPAKLLNKLKKAAARDSRSVNTLIVLTLEEKH